MSWTDGRMSRSRVALVLLAAVAMQAIALELSWVSTTGFAVDLDRETTISLAGGAVLPSATAVILFSLIAVVGAWVLPSWLRIAMAIAGIVAECVVTALAVRWLLAPDTSALAAALAGSQRQQLQITGPGLFLLAVGCALVGYRALITSSRGWPALSTRYDRGAHAEDPWRSLDRGIDPTDT